MKAFVASDNEAAKQLRDNYIATCRAVTILPSLDEESMSETLVPKCLATGSMIFLISILVFCVYLFLVCGFVEKNVIGEVCFLSFCLQMKPKMCIFVAEVVLSAWHSMFF